MNTTQIIRIIDRDQVIAGFIQVREDWEAALDGHGLVDADGSVGMLLVDLVSAIGLSPIEQMQALGTELSEAITPAAE